ncbi:P-type conjugative transfer ATPase TrbB [Hyphomonas pacifica]|uniref:P-type conjugative transfer ATPase TrbB n=1 Tax=Hyphomonas pacifica TaxID=1280941 RepID=UPI000DC040FF|nr:conjugal transfer protein TrbB [Hyphomonas pacifica]
MPMPDARSQTYLRTETMLKTAMGPAVVEALDDPAIVEVMVNPDGKIWIDAHGDGRMETGTVMPAAEAERVIRVVGSHIGQEVDRLHPIVSAELPGGGERFEGVIPPVTTAPCFSIRKPAARVFTLDDYVGTGVTSAEDADALRAAVRDAMNILIVGGTGSGKTTLANALLAEVALSGDRVVILEDTRELQCEARDKVNLRTQAGAVAMADLVRSTLRLRPDRIIVGEVRGGEALDMLKAWNTGHPGGIATIHANSAGGGLQRLEQLVSEVTAQTPHALIAEAIDLIVFIAGRGPERRIRTISRVLGREADDYRLEPFSSPVSQIVKLKGSSS